MSSIAPGTKIRLLKDVPLDNTYEHTIYFTSKTVQAEYFASKAKYSLNDYTYQRVHRNVVRVGKSADDCYDCNYLMFQNSNFGNKWFYAFITAVEYVNNEMCEVSFELDVMQTWLFDYDFEYTFVEREMSAMDNIGDNIVPENIALGEYVYQDYTEVDDELETMAVVVAIVDTETAPQGKVYDGVFGGATLYAFNLSDTAGINALIEQYTEAPDAVVGMYQLPATLINNGNFSSGSPITNGLSGTRINKTFSAISKSDGIDGYIPKNAKLLTYPYNFFHVDNGNGESLALRYEFFDSLTPKLEIGGTITQPVQVTCRPYSYKIYGSSGSGKTMNTEVLSLQGYPLCSWAVDTYKAWVAQNSVPLAVGLAGSAIGNLAAGNVVGAAAGTFRQAISIMQTEYKSSIAADMMKGSFNNGCANVAMKKQQFYCGRAHITREMAIVIDNFFSMYGYQTNRVKVPNRTSRPHWNYVKTIGCNIQGSVPADDMRAICQVYDKGVTFWKNGNEIGQYNLDNSV